MQIYCWLGRFLLTVIREPDIYSNSAEIRSESTTINTGVKMKRRKWIEEVQLWLWHVQGRAPELPDTNVSYCVSKRLTIYSVMRNAHKPVCDYRNVLAIFIKLIYLHALLSLCVYLKPIYKYNTAYSKYANRITI